jgi:hypothetical protein
MEVVNERLPDASRARAGEQARRVRPDDFF